MVTALMAVQNLSGAHHDVWAVNSDDEYHEEMSATVADLSAELEALEGTHPSVPTRLPADGAGSPS
jgi:hypothetical protein